MTDEPRRHSRAVIALLTAARDGNLDDAYEDVLAEQSREDLLTIIDEYTNLVLNNWRAEAEYHGVPPEEGVLTHLRLWGEMLAEDPS